MSIVMASYLPKVLGYILGTYLGQLTKQRGREQNCVCAELNALNSYRSRLFLDLSTQGQIVECLSVVL